MWQSALQFHPLNDGEGCVVPKVCDILQRWEEMAMKHFMNRPGYSNPAKLIADFSIYCSVNLEDHDYNEAADLKKQLESENLRMHTADKQAHIKFALAVCKFASLAQGINKQASSAKEDVDRIDLDRFEKQVAEIKEARDAWRREFEALVEAQQNYRTGEVYDQFREVFDTIDDK